ncbi:Iron-sulfur clusters transporter atm1 [Diplonema papillatum]|nr:Iron-sulfur clusters transporter atm1 [Diplonema papillatum]
MAVVPAVAGCSHIPIVSSLLSTVRVSECDHVAPPSQRLTGSGFFPIKPAACADGKQLNSLEPANCSRSPSVTLMRCLQKSWPHCAGKARATGLAPVPFDLPHVPRARCRCVTCRRQQIAARGKALQDAALSTNAHRSASFFEFLATSVSRRRFLPSRHPVGTRSFVKEGCPCVSQLPAIGMKSRHFSSSSLSAHPPTTTRRAAFVSPNSTTQCLRLFGARHPSDQLAGPAFVQPKRPQQEPADASTNDVAEPAVCCAEVVGKDQLSAAFGGDSGRDASDQKTNVSTNNNEKDFVSTHGPESMYGRTRRVTWAPIVADLCKELFTDAAAVLRVSTALLMMIGSKRADVQSAVCLKRAVDALAKTEPSSAYCAFSGRLLQFAALKLMGTALQEGKDAVFAPLLHRVKQATALRAVKKLQNLDYEFMTTRRHGSLARVVHRGERAMDRVPSILIFQFLPTAAELVMVSRALGSIGPSFALSNVAMALTYAAWSYPLTNLRLSYRKVMNHSEDLMAVRLSDTLANHELIRLENGAAREVADYEKVQKTYADAALKQQRSLAILRLGQRAIFTGTLAAMLATTGSRVSLGTHTVGDVVLLKTLMLQLSRPMELLGAHYRELAAGLTDLQQLFFLIKSVPQRVVDHRAAAPLPTQRPTTDAFRLTNVSYAYPRNTSPAVRNVSISGSPGTVTAIVGPSGCGKSTVARLISRQLPAASGSIHVFGRNVSHTTLASLRQAMSVVPQDPQTVRGSILRNIEYLPPGFKDRRQLCSVQTSLQKASLLPVIREKQRGLETPAHELSGGERQRVALARSFLKDAPIVVLDEPTSALDEATAHRVLSSLTMPRHPDKAIVLVGHRVPKPEFVDMIYVMDKGSVVDVGPHDQLMKRCSLYRSLQGLSMKDCNC